MACRQRHDLLASKTKEGVWTHKERAGLKLDERLEGGVDLTFVAGHAAGLTWCVNASASTANPGLRSIGPQTLSTSLPLGRSTRLTSRSALGLSGKN